MTVFNQQLALGLTLTFLPLTYGAGDDDKPMSVPSIEISRGQNSKLDQFLRNPDDIMALRAFIDDADYEVGMLAGFYENPDAADRRLNEFRAAVAQIAPTTDEAKNQLAIAKNGIIPGRALLVESTRASLAELEAALVAKPVDNDGCRRWVMKLNMVIEDQSQRDPDAAKKTLDAAKLLAARIAETTQDQGAKKSLDLFLRSGFRIFERSIDNSREALALIGRDAPRLDVQQWVNSPPLTLTELKGKVVLLDFFRVLSRNTVASIPHVRQWQERYANNGLVVIGLTPTFTSQWDEARQGLTQSPMGMNVTLEQQQATLQKLADFHKVKYPLAIRGIDRSRSYFGPFGTGIIVVDQQGKIRVARTPHRERDASEISNLLAELLSPVGSK